MNEIYAWVGFIVCLVLVISFVAPIIWPRVNVVTRIAIILMLRRKDIERHRKEILRINTKEDQNDQER